MFSTFNRAVAIPNTHETPACDAPRSALWIEDDDTLVRWGREVLTRGGFNVETASTGAEGVCRARRGNHDLILLDWELPDREMTGRLVLKTLREVRVTTPVMVCTGKFSSDEEMHARLEGARDFIQKPFTATLWLERINALLDRTEICPIHSRQPEPQCDPLLRWHGRLLSGDVAVQNELANALLPLLCRILARRHPRSDDAAVNTAVEEALLEYFASPASFDPSRLPLDRYLTLISRRRLSNTERASLRRRAHEVAVGTDLPDLAIVDEPKTSRWRDLRMIYRCCQTQQERAFLGARLRGERRTGSLASLLGVESLPISAQRAEVHRVMERLRFRIHALRRKTLPSPCTRDLQKGDGRGIYR